MSVISAASEVKNQFTAINPAVLVSGFVKFDVTPGGGLIAGKSAMDMPGGSVTPGGSAIEKVSAGAISCVDLMFRF
jgi:hypothetical protein